MKNSEQLDIWMSRLGQRKSLRVREDMVAEINAAIRNLENKPFVPWFLEQKAQLTVSAGDTSVSLPDNFILETEHHRPYYVLDGTVYYLGKRIRGAVFGFQTTSTSPQIYGIIGNTMEFRPVADQAYTFNLYYYAKNGGSFADDDNEVTNVWVLEAEEWIFAEAAIKVAALHLQNQALGADFVGLAAAAKRDIYAKHEAREHTNQDYEVGGVSDGS